jgi:hypothetical protein
MLTLCLTLALANMPPPPPAQAAPAKPAKSAEEVKSPGKPAAAPAAPAAPTAAVTWSEGLATPESVFYDAETDTYLVSNINGTPFAKDNNGYIAELSPDGKVVNAKLVTGGGKVTLNAPKGLGLLKGVLYVADIDAVRMFDRKTGAPKGEVAIKGATFLNDIATTEGKVYVSDSGFKPGKDGAFDPTDTDALYVIDVSGKKPVLKTILKSKDLKHPNGLWATADTLYMVPFGSNELTAFGLDGKKKGAPTALPKGGLDGVFMVGEEFFVSSWEGKAVYRGKAGGEMKEILHDLTAPADIGYDSKRNRVLVPRFMDNKVEAWDAK